MGCRLSVFNLKEETVVDFLVNSNLSEEEKELIAHKNAEKLFKL